MARYIDADKVTELIKNYGEGAISDGIKMLDPVDDIIYLAKGVELIPTADVVPRSEVAEIFEEIENMINLMCAATGLEMTYFGKYAELKKKYIGGQDDST